MLFYFTEVLQQVCLVEKHQDNGDLWDVGLFWGSDVLCHARDVGYAGECIDQNLVKGTF